MWISPAQLREVLELAEQCGRRARAFPHCSRQQAGVLSRGVVDKGLNIQGAALIGELP